MCVLRCKKRLGMEAQPLPYEWVLSIASEISLNRQFAWHSSSIYDN